jgi:hypothetical protein
LKRGRIPPEKLIVRQTLSRELDAHHSPFPTALAARQLAEYDKNLRPGHPVRFVYTLGKPGVSAWVKKLKQAGVPFTLCNGKWIQDDEHTCNHRRKSTGIPVAVLSSSGSDRFQVDGKRKYLPLTREASAGCPARARLGCQVGVLQRTRAYTGGTCSPGLHAGRA